VECSKSNHIVHIRSYWTPCNRQEVFSNKDNRPNPGKSYLVELQEIACHVDLESFEYLFGHEGVRGVRIVWILVRVVYASDKLIALLMNTFNTMLYPPLINSCIRVANFSHVSVVRGSKA
jgi:hypothetical protein